MKNFLLVLSLCFTAYGANPQSAAILSSPNHKPSARIYDMLEWMTMNSSMRESHYMAGTANPNYTQVGKGRFYYTKSAQGYPWDVNLYDDNYIYLWATELDWSNPSSYKAFYSPTSGNYNMPLVPRRAYAGFPGSTIKVSDSTFQIHSDCDTYVTQDLGYVINEVWGPYTENLGGDLPENLTTLVIQYNYTCNANYSQCFNREEYHVAKPYGLVKWQHQTLGADGNYNPPDYVSVFNSVQTGQVTPFTTCF